jgi:hypothetical protein
MSQGYTKSNPIDTDGTLSANSDFLLPSQKAVKTYIDTEINAENLQTIYNKSTPTAEIVTDATRGALTVQAGVSDTNTVIEVKNTVGTVTASLTGGGLLTSVAFSNSGNFFQAISRPAQITSDQNNYATAGLSILALTTDASRTITGFANGGQDGKLLIILNVGSFNIVLAHQSASSTAGNRIITNNAGTNITILPNESVTLIKDFGGVNRWRVISKSF